VQAELHRPACGSGAFVTTALGRLLAHFEADAPCHKELSKKGEPAWKSAEKRLKLVGELVHAIDLHPFASFLTTLNVLFMSCHCTRLLVSKTRILLWICTSSRLMFRTPCKPDKKTEEQILLFRR